MNYFYEQQVAKARRSVLIHLALIAFFIFVIAVSWAVILSYSTHSPSIPLQKESRREAPRLTCACSFPGAKGMAVFTDSPALALGRRTGVIDHSREAGGRQVDRQAERQESMIVSFVRYAEGEAVKGSGRWQYLDGMVNISIFPVFIRRVEKQEGVKDEVEGYVLKCFHDEAGTEVCEPDLYSVPRPAEKRVLAGEIESMRVSGALLMTREKVGTTVVCYEGYIMNDSGETIEKL